MKEEEEHSELEEPMQELLEAVGLADAATGRALAT